MLKDEDLNPFGGTIMRTGFVLKSRLIGSFLKIPRVIALFLCLVFFLLCPLQTLRAETVTLDATLSGGIGQNFWNSWGHQLVLAYVAEKGYHDYVRCTDMEIGDGPFLKHDYRGWAEFQASDEMHEFSKHPSWHIFQAYLKIYIKKESNDITTYKIKNLTTLLRNPYTHLDAFDPYKIAKQMADGLKLGMRYDAPKLGWSNWYLYKEELEEVYRSDSKVWLGIYPYNDI